MRLITLFAFFTILSITSFAQKITYDLPESFTTVINKDDYKKIVDMAIPIIEKRFVIDYVKNGAIELKKGQDVRTLNLDNLVMKCADETDKSKWIDIVQAHFNAIYATIDEQKKFDPNDFGAVKKYLSLRIYPVETVVQRGGPDNLLVKTDLEGTYTVLMLDLPGSFAPVQKSNFIQWKKDSTEVFKIAQANINTHPVEKVTKQFDIDGSKIEISFLGEENYAASYALDLMNNSPEFVGEWGSVIALPNKGIADLCKVDKTHPVDFVKFIQQSKALTEQSYQQHPQPISDKYFWYYKGKFTKINVTVDAKGNISVLAPLELSTLITSAK